MSNESLAAVPVVLSGPSGVGKTTVRDQLLSRYQDLVASVSATTRSQRPDEVQGKDYFFLSREEFRNDVEKGQFLEWAEVHGELYGTPKGPIEDQLRKGTDVLLVIDIQGGVQVKQIFPQSLLIFLLPPSMEDLKHRLDDRGHDDDEAVDLRIKNATEEVGFAKYYDYWVVNRHLEEAVAQVRSIIVADRCRASRAHDRYLGLGYSWPGIEPPPAPVS